MFRKGKIRFSKTTLGQSFKILDTSDRRKVIAVMIIQISLGLIDLFGIGLIGVLGALAVSGVESHHPGNRVLQVLKYLGIGHYNFQTQATILGSLAAFVLILRTALSIIFTRKILFFLSRRSAKISGELVRKLLSQNLLMVQKRSSQQYLYALTSGVSSIALGVLGATVSLVSDTSLIIILLLGLFIVDPVIAVGTLLVFGVIGYALYKLLNQRAKYLGTINAELEISSNEKILEVLTTYREAFVRNRRDFYARTIGDQRLDLSNILAEMTFMPNISKYVIESTVVLGSLGISAVQFAFQDAVHAISTLTIFLATGSRIAPAVLRLQQGSLQIRSSYGSAKPSLELIKELENSKNFSDVSDVVDPNHVGFSSSIILENITFTYPGGSKPALNQMNFKINPGEVFAIVGPSGAGKTTLVDVLLGVLEPQSGRILISGESPSTAISKWPGALAYVPQDATIVNATILENIALGFLKDHIEESWAWRALETAQLADFVKGQPNGIHTLIGEKGNTLSGGQRQRLGIARSLYTQPKLIVLDEATSALDGQTESDISEAILNLSGTATVAIIAHRLSTIRHVEKIVYLENGKILAVGNFSELRNLVPNFDQQAQLMGL
jgi:ABC-type multidrug transport system fused ATPase/permease subunit